ncbi:peptide deformylase [Candidatus Gottesmanbacteria bacterium RBG_16_52_11]|uniref:Peptide deformylase n=1 Tax=Candidatus Gottesmanbacteria bacterium RBG_16_52_11 TaxID=1798374 RepID=A0A1F5YMF6_9BACT|nr:MAG: peptide deformylase [Candidatus Gottesmanbacteria bacterium RBG_16_52_11]
MANLLAIAQLGHPVLRAQAEPVKNIRDVRIQSLIDDMLVTLKDFSGVGLAAPQVYQPLRICIIASYPNPRYPDAPYFEPTAMINPVITPVGKVTETDWEGCLSIPGIRAMVSRLSVCEVSFVSRDGIRQKRTLRGFIARIAQHETDHLNGLLFIDRVNNNRDLISEKEYLKLMENKPKRNASSARS